MFVALIPSLQWLLELASLLLGLLLVMLELALEMQAFVLVVVFEHALQVLELV